MVTDLNLEAAAPARQPLGRSALSRIKLGHVMMVLAAIFALVLNLAVLRSNEATAGVVIAAADIPAGTSLDATHFDTAIVPADDLLLARLVPATDIESARSGRP